MCGANQLRRAALPFLHLISRTLPPHTHATSTARPPIPSKDGKWSETVQDDTYAARQHRRHSLRGDYTHGFLRFQ